MHTSRAQSHAAPALEAGPRRLRIASYNIYKGHYHDRGDGRSFAADIAGDPQLRDADVLLVQEAVVGTITPRKPPRDTLAVLGAALGGAPAATRFLGARHGHDARWGVAILSRHPARFHDVPLPRASPWPRGAIIAEIGPFLVASLHLDVGPALAPGRWWHMGRLLQALAAIDPAGQRPTIVAGDFNCERGSAHWRLRRAGFTGVELGDSTWSWARILRLRLDHAYVRQVHVVGSGVATAARGSDHRPIWIEVEAAPAVQAPLAVVQTVS